MWNVETNEIRICISLKHFKRTIFYWLSSSPFCVISLDLSSSLFWSIVPCCNLNRPLKNTIILFVVPPKFCISIAFNFSWAVGTRAPREIENNFYAKFWRDNKKYYGIFERHLLGLQPRDKAPMLGGKTIEFFLENFT